MLRPVVSSAAVYYTSRGSDGGSSLNCWWWCLVFQKNFASCCESLPWFHAFTSYDIFLSFPFKGQIRPLSFLESLEIPSDNTVNEKENMFVKCMGKRRFIRWRRSTLSFIKHYQPKGKLPLAKVKGIDASCLRAKPFKCNKKKKRVNSICSIWKQTSV